MYVFVYICALYVHVSKKPVVKMHFEIEGSGDTKRDEGQEGAHERRPLL